MNQFSPKPISIHALLAESDARGASRATQRWNISIHALLAESDSTWKKANPNPKIFLSTLSLRRATVLRKVPLLGIKYFYPRSPCGERRDARPSCSGRIIFLSTLSLRRATAKVHKTVGHFCAYETNFMEIASSC